MAESTLLLADQVVCLDAGDSIFSSGYLVIQGSRITEIGSQSDLPGRKFVGWIVTLLELLRNAP